jgi:hypothetical protein
MSDGPQDPARPQPTRRALVWLFLLGLLYLGLVPVVIVVNGMPGGYGMFEVIILPAFVGLLLAGRSLWKLARGEFRR